MDSMSHDDFGWAPPAPAAPAPSQTNRWAATRTVLVVAVLAALVGAGVGAVVAHRGEGSGQTVVEKFTNNTSIVKDRPADIQAILAKVLPAVVTIQAYTNQSQSQSANPFFGGFGPGGTSSGAGGGTGAQILNDEGTGMVITAGGEVITNNHVVSGASSITVTLNGTNKALAASVVASDPEDDIALVQIKNEHGLATVSFGNSNDVKVGDGVVAVGNALGLEGGPSVTAGIISAEGRGLTVQDPNTGQNITLTDMLQTDAAINPGNSGGPLVDSAGQVIGMNSDEATGNGQSTAQNIGFAIPSDKITGLLPLLRKGGTVTPPIAYLGIQGGDETPQLQAEYGLGASQGALVEEVLANTPASAAGIQNGDVIVSFQGNPINSWDDLTQALREQKPGDKVSLGLYRGTQQLTVQVTLATAPSNGG
jgi:S1-C subfamily serine protease